MAVQAEVRTAIHEFRGRSPITHLPTSLQLSCDRTGHVAANGGHISSGGGIDRILGGSFGSVIGGGINQNVHSIP